MGDELFRRIENRLLRGKVLMDHIRQKNSGAPQQTSLELFMREEYSLPNRPDVEIERSVWAFRGREKKLAKI